MHGCVLRVCNPSSCVLWHVVVQLLKYIYMLCFVYYRSVLYGFKSRFGPVLGETLFVLLQKFVVLMLLALWGLGTLHSHMYCALPSIPNVLSAQSSVLNVILKQDCTTSNLKPLLSTHLLRIRNQLCIDNYQSLILLSLLVHCCLLCLHLLSVLGLITSIGWS